MFVGSCSGVNKFNRQGYAESPNRKQFGNSSFSKLARNFELSNIVLSCTDPCQRAKISIIFHFAVQTLSTLMEKISFSVTKPFAFIPARTLDSDMSAI